MVAPGVVFHPGVVADVATGRGHALGGLTDADFDLRRVVGPSFWSTVGNRSSSSSSSASSCASSPASSSCSSFLVVCDHLGYQFVLDGPQVCW